MEMTTSLTYLAWSSLLCVVLWLPYVLERIQRQGLRTVVEYKHEDSEPAAWAKRSNRAHLNLVENLAPFAALVLIANLTNVGVAGAAALFFGPGSLRQSCTSPACHTFAQQHFL